MYVSVIEVIESMYIIIIIASEVNTMFNYKILWRIFNSFIVSLSATYKARVGYTLIILC